MTKRRVVVTGTAVVSCFGMDVEAFYQKLLSGESGVEMIHQFPCDDYPTRFAASVRDFDTEGYLDKKQARRVDPFIAFAVVAGKKALESAGFNLQDLSSLDLLRCGIVIGSGMGGMKAYTDGVVTVETKGFKRLTPFFVPYIITNMGGALLSVELGFKGPNYSISTACATGTHSIIAAADHIRKGEADLMVCGGAEGAVNTTALAGFVACKALSERNDHPKQASRPWDKGRDGFVLGEGSGVLILEELEHAKKRGAKILAEYCGGAMTCDAYHLTDPIPDGAIVAVCMEKALLDAGIEPAKVQYLNAHATSTPVGDMCEIRAIKKVFGPHPKHLKINATKSMLGHSLGAAGGIEAVVSVLAIQKNLIHPTINLVDKEDELEGLDVVVGDAAHHVIDHAISNSFGFGGHNASVVFGRYRS